MATCRRISTKIVEITTRICSRCWRGTERSVHVRARSSCNRSSWFWRLLPGRGFIKCGPASHWPHDDQCGGFAARSADERWVLSRPGPSAKRLQEIRQKLCSNGVRNRRQNVPRWFPGGEAGDEGLEAASGLQQADRRPAEGRGPGQRQSEDYVLGHYRIGPGRHSRTGTHK